MAQLLYVPVSISALYCKQDQSLVEGMADFNRLPYSNKKHDFNPDTPYVSEDIVSQPFQNLNFVFKQGIHLHWSLPEALTRGTHSDSGTDFPAVPNRWLITRRALGVHEQKQWVVESDYLFPEGEGFYAGSVSYPVGPVPGHAPFRFLGRKMPLDLWWEKEANPLPDASGPPQYVNKLTAIGYGEPAFAAFYPNCHSVFGFHDPEIGGEKPPQDLTYDLIGWYSNDPQDYIHQYRALIQQFRTAYETQHGSGAEPLNEDIATMITQQLKWDVDAGTLDQENERLICYARIKFQPDTDIENPAQQATDTKICLANTGTEALAAYLAQTLASDHQHRIEDQLEGIILSPQLGQLQQDLGPRLQEARHEKGFVAVSGGSLWAIIPRMHTGAGLTDLPRQEFAPLPTELAGQLDQLNRLQSQYDQAQRKITALRRQVFSDWYKYMLTSYPPEGNQDDYPDIDELRFYIETKSISELNAVIQHTGELALARNDKGEVVRATAGTPLGNGPLPADAIAAELANSINETLAAIVAHNARMLLAATETGRQLKGNYLLQSITGPRFWRPREPHVLITGQIAQRESAPGQSGQDTGASIPCRQRNVANGSTRYLAGLNAIWGQIDELLDGAPPGQAGYDIWTHQPWQPLLLEWEVGFFPSASGANHNEVSGDYTSTYLTQNYQLLENASDLSVRPESVAVTNTAETYSGRNILTPHASQLLSTGFENQFIGMLKRTGLLAQYATAAGKEQEVKDDSWLIQHVDDLCEWYKENQHFIHQLINGANDVQAPDTGQIFTFALDWMDLKNQYYFNNGIPEENRTDLWLQQNVSEFFAWLGSVPNFAIYAINVFLTENDQSGQTAEEQNDFLNTHLDAFLLWYQQNLQRDFHAIVAMQGYESLKNTPSLSMSLGGFNQALLLHKQTLQMGVADPLAFAEDSPFVQLVRNAVGTENKFAPAPLNSFNPIRAGILQFIRMQLIDSFGQFKALEPGQVVTIYGEAYGVGDHPDLMTLAPRYVQPARLSFRWLSAGQKQQETNAHPDTSPICGWFLPNNLDSSLMVYGAQGETLGIIDPTGVWRSFPGQDGGRFDAGQDVPEFIIANPHLRAIVNQIRQAGANFIQAFISTLDSALENIDPDNFAAHQDLVLLIGRPVVLVRAALRLELLGAPATRQDWPQLRKEMDGGGEDWDQFTRVQAPIRLGEYRQLNDGLLGYWKEDADGLPQPIFYTPESDEGSHALIVSHREDTLSLCQSIEDAPQTVSMLVDPRGVVHATTGVLPAKMIGIPPDHYREALKKIQVGFLTSPILTSAENLALELPAEEGYEWSWAGKDRHRWASIPASAMTHLNPQANFSNDVIIREGWLKLQPKDD